MSMHPVARGAQQLASALARNRSLVELQLARNNIGDPGAEDFLAALDVAKPRPSGLRRLDLSGNAITRRQEDRLLSAFHRNITVLSSLRLTEDQQDMQRELEFR